MWQVSMQISSWERPMFLVSCLDDYLSTFLLNHCTIEESISFLCKEILYNEMVAKTQGGILRKFQKDKLSLLLSCLLILVIFSHICAHLASFLIQKLKFIFTLHSRDFYFLYAHTDFLLWCCGIWLLGTSSYISEWPLNEVTLTDMGMILIV